ncbi:MAG: hypothetical protein LBJ67_05385 [Planctomycetaceae bacterium]|jgi:hypothetical protein|nr:hypothetical protein [Planctomycetaceae bacterium]
MNTQKHSPPSFFIKTFIASRADFVSVKGTVSGKNMFLHRSRVGGFQHRNDNPTLNLVLNLLDNDQIKNILIENERNNTCLFRFLGDNI